MVVCCKYLEGVPPCLVVTCCAASCGLAFEAIEDFDPAHWHDILLDGPKRAEQLEELVPVAEKAGVRLAAHPDDPPLDVVRGQPRLVYQPDMYQRLLDLVPSSHNALEFCLGTLSEMTDGDIYEVCERYVKQGQVAYIHFRNVRGKVPDYTETFIDEGQIDMRRIMRILQNCGYEGVVIPDHTPQMSWGAPWHAGMAYAMGYMKALIGELALEHNSHSRLDLVP